jgi:hypothetical protein
MVEKQVPKKEKGHFLNASSKPYQDLTHKGNYMHKKIMAKAAKALSKDAKHYKSDAKSSKSNVKKKHDHIEEKEAMSAAKDMRKRSKMAHEY